jgi:hypothetical protein
MFRIGLLLCLKIRGFLSFVSDSLVLISSIMCVVLGRGYEGIFGLQVQDCIKINNRVTNGWIRIFKIVTNTYGWNLRIRLRISH